MTPEAPRTSATWRPAVLATTLAVLATLPSLDAGFLLDDHVHRVFLSGTRAENAYPWDLFFVCGRGDPADVAQRIAAGVLPWWTAPQLSIALFRPLSVATHFLDYALWPDTPALMHAHNTLWYALLVLLTSLLYVRVLGKGALALTAAAIYSLHPAHTSAVTWIASRNTLLSALWAVAAITAHDLGRRRGERRYAWLSAGALAVGLGCGEGALAALPYLLAHALLLDAAPLRARIRALLPALAVLLVWAAVYRGLGYGVRASGIYRDPVDVPWIFLSQRLPRVLPLILRDVLLPPASILQAFGVTHVVFARALGWVVLALVLWAVAWSARRRPALAFFLLGSLGSAVVIAGATDGSMSRLLFMTSVGGCAAGAELLLWLAAARRRARGALRRASLGGAAALLALLLLGVGPLFLPIAPRLLRNFEGAFRAVAASFPDGARDPGRVVYVLNTPSYFATTMAPFYDHEPGRRLKVTVLGASPGPSRLTRTAADTFVLQPRGGFLSEPSTHLVRAPELPFRAGERVRAGGVEVTVLELLPNGHAARAAFRFPELASPARLFVHWHEGRFAKVALPPVGQSLWL